MASFGALLATAIERQSLSQSAFARQAKVPKSAICEIISGHRKPPMAQAQRWATLLELPKDERLRWRRAAALARADACLAEWIEELEAEIGRLAAKAR